jgi:hypothetical protein
MDDLAAVPQSIEVKVTPLSGCASAILAILSLGVIPLAIRSTQRRWPLRMTPAGLLTRAGRIYAWSDIQAMRHVVSIVNYVRTERWDLEGPAGVVSTIVPHRLQEGAKVLHYARLQIERTRSIAAR